MLQNPTYLTELVTQQVAGKAYHSVGLVASPMTIKHGLYCDLLNSKGIQVLIPSETEQSVIEDIIRDVIAGQSRIANLEVLRTIASSLLANGAEKVILGCTELSVLVCNEPSVLYIDPLALAVENVLKN